MLSFPGVYAQVVRYIAMYDSRVARLCPEASMAGSAEHDTGHVRRWIHTDVAAKQPSPS